MTKIEFTIELLTKIRLWEQSEDTRMRGTRDRLRARSTFKPVELQILFTLATLAPASIGAKDITIGKLGSFRKEADDKSFDRIEEMGYIRKQSYPTTGDRTVDRYFITDLGMKFVNTVMK